MGQQLQIALRTTLIICLGFPFLGVMIKNISYLIANILAGKGSYIYALIHNYLTIPGVWHHELSHALLTVLTGAKIININLFKPNKETQSLGDLKFVTRGPMILQSIQMFLIAIAPVPCGLLTCWLIIHFLIVIPNLNIGLAILLRYLIFCILLHTTMSRQDLEAMAKGFLIVFLLAFITSYLTQFDILIYLKDFV